MAQLTPTSNYDDPVVAQQAKNLTKAIFQHESGMDYNAVGDAGTSHGAGQWQHDTWKAQAKDVLGDSNAPMTPENQNVVAQGAIRKLISEGKNAAQIAAIWNSGSDQNWENKVGTTTINGKPIAYNVPQYVKKVTDLYQQYKGQDSSQTGSGGLPPPPPTVDTPQISSANASDGTQQSQGVGGEIANLAGKAANFLFPIAGDAANLLQGKNTKSPLQVLGDTALSVLPFIPGLGELGEGARGLAAGAEGVGAAVDATRGAGAVSDVAQGAKPIMQQLISNPYARNAGIGYGAGVAQNLSQGQGIGQALTPNASNITGAVLGGASPLLGKALGSIAQKASGIDPVVANELQKIGLEANPENAQLYDKYIQAAKNHAGSLSPSVENVAADNLDTAASKIEQIGKQAGKAKNDAELAASGIQVQPEAVATVGQNFADRVKNDFGLHLVSDENGNVTAVPISGSFIHVAPQEQARIESIATQLNKLYNTPGANVKNVSDVIGNIDGDINYNKRPYGQGTDPLNGLLQVTRGEINHNIIRTHSGALAKANDRISSIKNLQHHIRELAGNKLQRGELLMQRVLGNRSADSLKLFDAIKKETGIDLTKHAILAKHAIQAVGSKQDQSALEKMINAATAHTNPLMSLLNPMGIASGIARHTFANPEKLGRQMITGRKGLMPQLLNKAIGTGIRTGVATPGLVQDQIGTMGH